MSNQLIGYIRVSTTDQNTERQLDGLKLNRIFTDKCSGKDTNRPQLQEMIKFVRDGDILYVHSMDRLARNLDDLRAMVNQLANKKVEVRFVKEGLHFNGKESAMATLMLSVMGAFAEFERSLIRERQKEGIAIAKKAGVYKGRSKKLNDEQMQEVRDLLAKNYKKVDIAAKFNISRVALHRYLQDTTSAYIATPKINPIPATQSIKVKLDLIIENNSDWVRGKKKSYESIEFSVLSEYEYKKISSTTYDRQYIITLEYKNDKDLDDQIDELLSIIASEADNHDCQTFDTSISTLDGEKHWD